MRKLWGTVVVAALVACGGAENHVSSSTAPPPPVAISIAPKSTSLSAGSTVRFTAAVTNAADSAVVFSAPDGGSVDASGLFTAPAVAGDYRVIAAARADPSRTAVANVAVSVAGVPQIAVRISPDPLYVSVSDAGFFHASVTGTPDTAVEWTMKEVTGSGTVNVNGVYHAPDSEGVWHVIARSHADPRASAEATVIVTFNLVDHGGRVWPDVHAWAVFWGDVATFEPDVRPAMEALLSGVGGSSYLAIADQYMRGATAAVSFSGTLIDSSDPPAHPPQTPELSQLCNRLTSSGLKPDAQTMLFIFTANSPPGTGFCGVHGSFVCGGVLIPYALVPNAAAGQGCYLPSSLGCNNLSAHTGGMVSIAAHELTEAMTDPFHDAWTGFYNEIADACEWRFSRCVTLRTGSFQIQEQWSNAAHGCVQQ